MNYYLVDLENVSNKGLAIYRQIRANKLSWAIFKIREKGNCCIEVIKKKSTDEVLKQGETNDK